MTYETRGLTVPKGVLHTLGEKFLRFSRLTKVGVRHTNGCLDFYENFINMTNYNKKTMKKTLEKFNDDDTEK